MPYDQGATIHNILAAAARNHSNETANSGLIISEAVEEIMVRAAEHTLSEELPDANELLRGYITTRLTGEVKRQADKLKRRIISGKDSQGVLDLGEQFDVTLTVCGAAGLTAAHGVEYTQGRITTLGSLASSDFNLMRTEALVNLEKQQAAYMKIEPKYIQAAAQLRNFTDYESYRRASHGIGATA